MGPVKSSKDPEGLRELCLLRLARMMTRSYDNRKRMETEFDQEGCSSWLSGILPSDRNYIMNIIYSCKLTRNKTTTRKFGNETKLQFYEPILQVGILPNTEALLLSSVQQGLAESGGSGPSQRAGEQSAHQDRLPHH